MGSPGAGKAPAGTARRLLQRIGSGGLEAKLETRGGAGPGRNSDPTDPLSPVSEAGPLPGDGRQQGPEGDRELDVERGLFTNGVVQGLRGLADTQRDGFVTTHELYPWLRDYVEKEAAKVGRTLTPLIKDLDPVVSEGEFGVYARKVKTEPCPKRSHSSSRFRFSS